MKPFLHGVVVGIAATLFVMLVVVPSGPPPSIDPIVDSLRRVSDSLTRLQIDVLLDRQRLRYRMEQDSVAAAERDRLHAQTIRTLEQKIRNAQNTHSRPTPELDSIVRQLYGPNALDPR